MSSEHPFRVLIEKVKAEEEIYQIKLPVKDTELDPVLSKESVDLHYGTLYKNYVKKALAGEGEFQVAGAVLHTLFFEQFQKPSTSNAPFGESKVLIEKHFDTFEKFKSSFTESALSVHGSGWVYLTRSGKIKTIQNHKVVDDVAVIIDMWEHSFILDYGSDKEKYLKDIWKIVNWSIVNARLS